MKKQAVMLLGLALMLSGCVARTYPLTRDRVDQDLTSGNKGYLMGSGSGEIKDRKDSRTVRVFEIELGRTHKANKNYSLGQSEQQGTSLEQPVSAQESFQKYTVEKNDTLQKISKKFFGTTKKWMKIYEVNKDTLKAPDRLYVGQVINIPEGQEIKEASEPLNEPKENLK